MSVLYCTIPHFAAAVTWRDDPNLRGYPLVLIDPQDRVFAASAEAASCGVIPGLMARVARVRCPQARLLEADVARYRQELETLLELLECVSTKVEPHGWGAAYVDLEGLARNRSDAVALCGEIGQAVRRELGSALQPALGWDNSKFTAQTAARRTRPGRLLAVPTAQERDFLSPLPAALLPLAQDVLLRLRFLGLRTLGQYAALSTAAVWQQFGRAGNLAHRYARGEDDRPVIPRWQAPRLSASYEFDVPLAERARLLAALKQMVSSMLAEIRGNLQACGQLRLTVHFDDGSAQERTRTFLFSTAEDPMVLQALGQLVDKMRWPAPATALDVCLEQIQDVVMEQLMLFPGEHERERKLEEVKRYLAARFGASRLRRVALVQPGAPLPEWRVGWVNGEGL